MMLFLVEHIGELELYIKSITASLLILLCLSHSLLAWNDPRFSPWNSPKANHAYSLAGLDLCLVRRVGPKLIYHAIVRVSGDEEDYAKYAGYREEDLYISIKVTDVLPYERLRGSPLPEGQDYIYHGKTGPFHSEDGLDAFFLYNFTAEPTVLPEGLN